MFKPCNEMSDEEFLSQLHPLMHYYKDKGWAEWEPYFLRLVYISNQLDWVPRASAKWPNELSRPQIIAINEWCAINCKSRWMKWSEVCYLFEDPDEAIQCKLICS